MFSKRIERLRKILLSHQLDTILVENPLDLFYLTGQKISAGKLLVGLKEILFFVDGRYFEKVKDSTLFHTKLISKESLKDFFSTCSFQSLGFDGSFMSYENFQNLSNFIKKTNEKIKLVSLKSILKHLRMVKDAQEISYMRKSAQLNWRSFEYLCSILKEGISEKALAMEFEIYCKKNGADALSFDPIIAFGTHTAIPHHEPTSRTLKEDDVILIDCGVKVKHYCSDMTRVIFWGKPNAELEKMYMMVKRAQNLALNLCRPGTPLNELNQVVQKYFSEVGYAENLLHGIGHGMGLEIHEYPKFASEKKDQQVLKPGMVLTIEPGIYLEGVGGVRYEDTIVITQNGHENFYTS